MKPISSEKKAAILANIHIMMTFSRELNKSLPDDMLTVWSTAYQIELQLRKLAKEVSELETLRDSEL